ncbi:MULTISPECIES: patatin-like phospholipase family protein [Roseomonadaceae]|uniref:Patatin-like phospholipase family protein n=1 Tax=Falsiroseomonas oleicola TaxID=2801474 RepID=A0ABS6H751_9PROT|nr:patatin-like phospholipase family protein [Roseomonas oleicola]MBU8544522.1 patatin-like phospholipase family protein [Roseomonas oleicola]
MSQALQAPPAEVPSPTDLPRSPAARQGIPAAVALQGGGSLGAFAWGVLDQLLDEPALRIEVASGASAGAMNAAFLVQGLATGGRAEARRLLEAFWRRVAVASGSPDSAAASWLFPFTGMMAPMLNAMRANSMALSQKQMNPLGINPLTKVLDGLLDPTVFGRPGAPQLVVSTTRVRTGEARLFVDEEVTAQVLLASACLPQMFPAVEIDGEAYWDGGYACNPPIRALIESGAPTDILIIRTTPVDRPAAPPTDAAGLLDRTNELTFGAALRQELRSVAFAQRVLAKEPDPSPILVRLRDARLHMIGAEEAFRALETGSRQDPSWSFLQEMRDLGHRAADRWLSDHRSSIGLRSTLDLAPLAVQQVPERRRSQAALP